MTGLAEISTLLSARLKRLVNTRSLSVERASWSLQLGVGNWSGAAVNMLSTF